MKKSRGAKRKVNHSKKQKKSLRCLRFLPAAFVCCFLLVIVLLIIIHPATGNVIYGNLDLGSLGNSTLGTGTNFI